MNKSYRSIWNEALGAWVAGAENTKARGKRSKSRLVASAGGFAMVMAGTLGLAGLANAQNYTAGGATAGSVATPASGWNNPLQNPVKGIYDTAVGNAAYATQGGTAFGDTAVTSGFFGVALGAYSAAAHHATAVGSGTMATGNDSSAFGYNALASGSSSLAIGVWSKAAGDNTVSLGNNANASVANSVALGAGSTTTSNLAANGYNSGSAALSGTASTANGEVSVGSAGKERRVTNVAAGAAATDAVNVSQLQSEAAKSNAMGNATAAALGGGAAYNATTGAITAPSYTVGGKPFGNVGGALTNLDGRVTQNTDAVTAMGNNPITFAGNTGTVAKKLGETVTITGAGTTGSFSGGNLRTQVDANGVLQLQMADNAAFTSVTAGNTKMDTNGVAIVGGPSMTTSGIDAGNKAISNLRDGSASTDAATVGQVNKAAADAAANATADAVKYDDATHSSVTLGGAGASAPVKLGNVADGAVYADSKDAINGGQLYGASQKVADALGGNASVKADGTISAPSYTVGGKPFNNVGGALTNLDGRVTQNTDAIDNLTTNLNNGSVGLVQQAGAGANLTVGKATDGVAVDFADKDGNTRTLKNVTAGVANTDAVNVSQLKATGLIDANGKTLDAVTYDAGSNKGSITLGGANGTQIKNVAAGTDDSDAVNVSQLKKAGLVDGSGNTLDAVTYDAGSNRGKVTFGNAGAPPVLLSNVAQGMADTDAVNVGQLRGVTSAMGGGASIDANGNVVAPSYIVNNTAYTNIGDALTSLSGQIGAVGDAKQNVIEKTTIQANSHLATSGDESRAASAIGDNAVALGAGATASASNSVALGAGSVSDRENTVSVGSAGNERAIANVADGVMTHDAVNKGQLDSVADNAKAYTDQRVNQVQQQVGDVARNSYSGVAAATALTMIPNVDPGKKFAMGVGVGSFKNYAAMAVAASARLNDRVTIKAGVGMSAAGSTVGAGATYQW
ncbi:YadA-like family protein [Variovorax ureilyticus]|uniref:YadA-like family protein n=1 Tax=Variovorax ureilyticus TaxID=1836198 RepID=UPI003D676E74